MNIYTVIGKWNGIKIDMQNLSATDDKDARSKAKAGMPTGFKVLEVKLTGTKED